MNFSDQDIWKALYIGLGIAGLGLLVFAFYVFKLAKFDNDPWRFLIPGIVVIVVGLACILFAIVVFIFRDDHDIWD